jgi:hypothetical protein
VLCLRGPHLTADPRRSIATALYVIEVDIGGRSFPASFAPKLVRCSGLGAI